MKIPITLVAIDGTLTPLSTLESVIVASKQVEFADVLFLHFAELPKKPTSRIRTKIIRRLDLDGYNRFCLRRLHEYIETSHCLTIQNDSRIVNPQAWNEDWLKYDYIGAPWPPGWSRMKNRSGEEYRVGNSGFCLRSLKLLKATHDLPVTGTVWQGKTLPQMCRDDAITCCMFREKLESQGLRFASVEIAAAFSFEQPNPEAKCLTQQFGTHQFKIKS